MHQAVEGPQSPPPGVPYGRGDGGWAPRPGPGHGQGPHPGHGPRPGPAPGHGYPGRTGPAGPPGPAPVPPQSPPPQAPPPQGAPPPQFTGTTGAFPLPPPSPVQLPSPTAGVPNTPPPPIAVLLIGPAGAGKTTIARHWADHRSVPTAHISLDDVREWVRAGFADPQSGWNENSEAQYRLARRTCGFAARNFLANGISCIIDDAVFPDRPVVGLGGWKRHVGPGLLPVVLLPGLEIVLARNAERSGNRRLADEEVARIHGRMAGWYGSGLPIIDNSKLDVPAAAKALDQVVARSMVGPPVW